MSASGGYDVFEHLGLSGEPLISQLGDDYPNGRPNPPLSSIGVQKTVLQLNSYREAYRAQWEKTAEFTKTREFELETMRARH